MTVREQAIRLCEIAASSNGVRSLDALVLASEFAPEAGDLADAAHDECILDLPDDHCSDAELWASAAERLRDGWSPS